MANYIRSFLEPFKKKVVEAFTPNTAEANPPPNSSRMIGGQTEEEKKKRGIGNNVLGVRG
jgi:hypothetical protein